MRRTVLLLTAAAGLLLTACGDDTGEDADEPAGRTEADGRVETDDGLVLVDGGWAIPESRQLFEAGLRQLGYTPRDVRRFLVTHMHRDHYTQAYVVGREVGATVSLGLGDKATMDLTLEPEAEKEKKQ